MVSFPFFITILCMLHYFFYLLFYGHILLCSELTLGSESEHSPESLFVELSGPLRVLTIKAGLSAFITSALLLLSSLQPWMLHFLNCLTVLYNDSFFHSSFFLFSLGNLCYLFSLKSIYWHMFRYHSCLVLGDRPYVVLGIEPRSARCKANCTITLALIFFFFFF